jgi:hypothetical protein
VGDALQSYRQSLAIAERLVAADGSNTQWRDEEVPYNSLF